MPPSLIISAAITRVGDSFIYHVDTVACMLVHRFSDRDQLDREERKKKSKF
ncbi:unnamed protein product [Arabidopsis lyrata]|uniref:Predicted protein n=2 Tax=Arabidopsis TaxID=3701 RepID=D7LM20_ARALL|nr:predicted protein [Arabidopsis lyrata subsp. lyrata]KAG7542608.1 hypothetical protein ISN45_Aa07g025710 [Arabidopsis thaliana x Arabidopsis arenosa]CAH8267071.1 unnamed protein product [Arabidopsis lyrata]